MTTEQRRDAVIAGLCAGTLPREQPLRVWGGVGTDVKCALCGDQTRPRDVEYEIEFASGASVTFHDQCYAIWNEERDRFDGVD